MGINPEHIEWGSIAGWVAAAGIAVGWLLSGFGVIRRIDRLESGLGTRMQHLETSHRELSKRLNDHIDRRTP